MRKEIIDAIEDAMKAVSDAYFELQSMQGKLMDLKGQLKNFFIENADLPYEPGDEVVARAARWQVLDIGWDLERDRPYFECLRADYHEDGEVHWMGEDVQNFTEQEIAGFYNEPTAWESGDFRVFDIVKHGDTYGMIADFGEEPDGVYAQVWQDMGDGISSLHTALIHLDQITRLTPREGHAFKLLGTDYLLNVAYPNGQVEVQEWIYPEERWSTTADGLTWHTDLFNLSREGTKDIERE